MENELYDEARILIVSGISIAFAVLVVMSVLLWRTSRKKDIQRKKKYLLDILNLNRKNGKH